MEAIMQEMAEDIQWFAQAAVKIETENKTVYIDPYKLEDEDEADLILVTHSHSDHLSISDIKKVAAPATRFFAPKDCAVKIEKALGTKVTVLEPGMADSVDDIKIEAVPAYNIKKNFHKKEYSWVGYVLTIKGVRIYHAGDTERIPEMKTFTADIVLLPLGQTYTMSGPQEAADAALDVKAKIAIPFHYGMYEGTVEDAYKFKEILEGKIKVIIKERES